MRRDSEMTFGEHLEALRAHIIRALVGIAVAAAICGVFYKPIVAGLIRPYKEASEALAARSETLPEMPTPDQETRRTVWPPPRIIQGDPISLYIAIILVSLLLGAVVASPWVIYQAWAFVGVALYPRERRFVYAYGLASFVLFFGGAVAFYFLMLPIALQTLMGPASSIVVDGVPMIDPSLFIGKYLRFVAWMTLIFGVAFQTPIIVLFLARTGIVPLESLARKQKFVILLMCVLGAVLTPQDPVTMVLMAVPLIALYEVGLLLAWLSLRKRRGGRPEEAA
ncbi:MAG: twin-arginine translocase subunit TatC [Phycisphaerae bacterium]